MQIGIFEYLTILIGLLNISHIIRVPLWVVLTPLIISVILRIMALIWWESKSDLEKFQAIMKRMRRG